MPEQVRCAADKGLHFLLQQWLLNENYRHFLKARNEHFSPRHLTNETATLPPSPRSHFAGSPQQCSHSCPSKNDRTTTTTAAIIKRLRNGPTSSSTRPPRSSTPVWLNGSAGELTVWNTVIITRGRSGTISANKSPPHPSYPLQLARTIEAGDLYHK